MPAPLRRTALLLGAWTLAACAGRSTPDTGPVPASLPHRVVATAGPRTVGFDALVADAATADVVVFGEQHDDRPTHEIERILLEEVGAAAAAAGRSVILSVEMFERDVQPALDDYLAGRLAEAAFLERARPWPRYETDYRPLIETARARGWRVLAANVPRRIAIDVARGGLAALDSLAPADRALAAAESRCPRDDYHRRFVQEMQGHAPAAPAMPTDSTHAGAAAHAAAAHGGMADRYYESQCVKDETMAESIARAAAAGPSLVVHFNGAFHSDFGFGVVDRVRRRMPGARIVTVSALPVRDPRRADPAPNLRRADYLIFTRRAAAPSPH